VVKKNKKEKKQEFNHYHLLGKLLLALLNLLKYHDSEEPDKFDIHTTHTASTIHLGKEVVRLYITNLFKIQTHFTSLSLFRNHLIENNEMFKTTLIDDSFYSFVGGRLMDILIVHGVIDSNIVKKNNKNTNFLKISSKLLLNYKNKTLAAPVKLPMIVIPKKYDNNKLGGYLLNDVEFIDDFIVNKPTPGDSHYD
jgi:hypothetical protein